MLFPYFIHHLVLLQRALTFSVTKMRRDNSPSQLPRSGVTPIICLLSATRKSNIISRHFSTSSATMPHMSTQAERPKSARTRRQPLGFTNDIVRPGKLWPVSVHGFPLLPDEQPVSSVQTLVVAALLHDIGHYPFSHTIEELGYPIVHHEKVGRSIIENGEIATILEQDYHLSPGRVADFIDPPKTKALPPDDELLSHLLSGALDVDKLDYLPRDARACNVPYGGVDVARLQLALRIHPNVHNQRRIVVTHKGISPLHSLLHARQEMFDNIYWHHTTRALQVMLMRAVQEALLCEAMQVKQLVGLDDASLLSLLAETHMPTSSRKLADDLEMRRPYKVIIEISRLAGRIYSRLEALFWDTQRRRHVEQLLAAELASALGLEIADYEILFDIPRPEKWEMDVWVTFSNPPVGMNSLVTWVEATGLQPDDLARYEQHQRRIRVVVPERLRESLLARKDDVLLPTLEKLVEM